MNKEIPSPYPEFLEAYNAFKYGNGPEPDQKIISECFMFAFITCEPLPRELVGFVARQFMALRGGHDCDLFAKPESITKPLAHPDQIYLERRAVSYVRTCKREGWDTAPVATICNAFDISRATYHRWEKKYPTARDDYTREGARMLIEELAPLYRKRWPKPIQNRYMDI